MYRVTTAVHVHFSHHVRGHSGPCISLHGHTWKFELTLASPRLDVEGFVVDFDRVHELVLDPCHRLLDHSLALGHVSYAENEAVLAALGENLLGSRRETLGHLGEAPFHLDGELGGAKNLLPGGMKVAVFPFTPTSERLAEWFFGVAAQRIANADVRVVSTRVYESLHPVATYAEFVPG
ncbi:MAG: 6-carboxytetrahydropterin synthase [Polyangiaceae bacterium]|nr:6-carboxytetrahydropterin synthase [Polyangiaceae bacterium]